MRKQIDYQARVFFFLLVILFFATQFANIRAQDVRVLVQVKTFDDCVSAPPAATYMDTQEIEYNMGVIKFQAVMGAPPPFSAGSRIKAGGSDLKLSYTTVPCVGDWNEDGKKDLLVGEFYGYVYVYLNSGTNTNPTFATGTKLQAGGTDLKVLYG